MSALKYALSLAQEADGRLTVVHVSGAEFVGQVGIGEEHVSVAALLHQHEEEARKLLDKAVPESTAAYCRVETVLLRGTGVMTCEVSTPASAKTMLSRRASRSGEISLGSEISRSSFDDRTLFVLQSAAEGSALRLLIK